MDYFKSLMDRLDEQDRLEGATRLGIEQGRTDIARRMLDDGMPADVITKYTGLTPDQVAQL